MIDVVMIMGFLGSGKTTLLERILKNREGRVGVIVNEFGALSVDGERLEGFGGAEIRQVNSGSIFCACKSDFFIQSLLSLADLGLKRIYVEASGLANPSSVEKIMNDVNTLNKTQEEFRVISFVCVADAERIAALLQVSVAAVSQVQRSQVILLNKIDHVDKMTQKAAIESILAVNAEAKILPCVRCAVDMEALMDEDACECRLECVSPEPISERSFVVIGGEDVQRSKLDAFLKSVIPISVRIKGFLKVDGVMHNIDVVPPYITVEPKTEASNGKLVIIVYEDEKLTAKGKIETLWQRAFGRMPDEIVV